MYLLRVGRKRRWRFEQDAGRAEDVAEASRDLELAIGEEGLSVYRVTGEAEAREVAVRWALTCRSGPQNMDYVVFPSDLASDLGLTISHVTRGDPDPFLNARHSEIIGLTPELASQLAATILGNARRWVERIQEQELKRLGAELCRSDPELKKYLIGEWVPLLRDPAPEE